MKWNRILATFAVALAALSGIACESQQPNNPDATAARVKIGVLTPLTGEGAAYGRDTQTGLEFAAAAQAGPIELVFKDTRLDPLEAVRTFKELQGEGVALVIGPFTSTEVRQVGPEAQRVGIPLITTSATADDLSSIGDYVFMMLPPNSRQGADQARYALNVLGVKRAAIIYRENPYGQTLRKAFFDTFSEGGGTIVADLGFPDGEENFRGRLQQVRAQQPEVLFIPVHDADTGRILRQGREVNLSRQVRILGADGSMSDTTLRLAGDAAEGSVYSNVASVLEDFDNAFKAKTGSLPSPYVASAYDTYRIVAELIAAGARNAGDLQKGLVGLTGHSGATGTTKFILQDKSYWALEKPYRQFGVKNGSFVLIR